MKTKKKIRGIAFAALIAAMYTALTLLSSSLGLANGAIQVRLSEVLTVLPVFNPYAIPGLFAGCLISNIITGCALWDIILGSFATLLGGLGTYFLKEKRLLAPLPPIITNTVIVPLILTYVYNLNSAYWYFALTVFAGEFISCGILGTFLQKSLYIRDIINKINN